jgi:hypothetical protein
MINENWMIYPYVRGEILTGFCGDKTIVKSLIDYLEGFWDIEECKFVDLREDANSIYLDKTQDRLNLFMNGPYSYVENQIKFINDYPVDSIAQIFSQIGSVAENYIPAKIHGDLQPENIIFDSESGSFTLIDFRENFGSNEDYGDLYYDLSKMLHGCLISNRSVIDQKYSVVINKDRAYLSIETVDGLKNLADEIMSWMDQKSIDKVKCLKITGMHYLNISPLYKGEYSIFLYLLGKLMLYKVNYH